MKGVPAEVTARPAPTPAPRRSAVRRALAWAIVSVLAPSRAAMRGISLAGVISIAGSIATGAAVRLSQSGLGCTTWPNCTGQSLVAASSRHSSLMHAWVEFGNRLFVTLVMIVSIVVLVAAWRYKGDELGAGTARRWPPRRRLLVGLAAVQPAGVVAQAILGGIVVLTNLSPVSVSIHFLATMAILAAAVALYDMFAVGAQSGAMAVRPELRWLSAALLGVTSLMVAAGTVVTGTGPRAGAADVPRYRLPLEGVTQFHADIGWLLGGLTVAMVVGLRFAAAPPPAVRLGWLLLGLTVLQGVIGYSQYFSGLPAGLVWVHVLGSAVIWITVLRLFFALRPRAATPAAG
jgi:cytochrome c oxidase assembly protein subunit 15